MKWIDLSLSGLVVLLTGLLAVSPSLRLPLLVFGALWLVVGWTKRLPLILVAGGVFVASRSSITADLPTEDVLWLTLGLAVWVANEWIPETVPAAGWLLGLLWGGLFWGIPGAWVSLLCLLPRLSVLTPGRRTAITWSAMVAGLLLICVSIWSGRAGEVFLRPGESRTYEEILHALTGFFRRESLFALLALVALFDLAQASEQSPFRRWLSLSLLAIPMLFLFLEPSRALGLVFWVGFPVTSVLLTRWTLTLPHLSARIVFWAGLVLTGVLL